MYLKNPLVDKAKIPLYCSSMEHNIIDSRIANVQEKIDEDNTKQRIKHFLVHRHQSGQKLKKKTYKMSLSYISTKPKNS